MVCSGYAVARHGGEPSDYWIGVVGCEEEAAGIGRAVFMQ